MSGPHAAFRTPVKPAGKHPDGRTRYVLGYSPQLQRISKHRGGHPHPWNDHTRAKVHQILRKLIQSRKTETVNRKAGLI